MLIEYCGFPDDPSYAAGMRRKQQVYTDNGLDALLITPDRLKGDWPVRLLRTNDDALATRLATFRGATATTTVARHPFPSATASRP